MPKISVIVPVYKVEPYLRRCVDSILAQTFSDFELILVDDGSPDGCPAICDEYAKMDDRVRVIHKANGGLSDARNAGLDVAVGEFISFVDSDDYVSNEYLQKMFDIAERMNADFVACGVINVWSDHEEKWPDLKNSLLFSKSELIRSYSPQNKHLLMPTACEKLYRRKIFDTIRFTVGIIFEDFDIQLRIIEQSSTIVILNEHLYYYVRERDKSILNSSYSKRMWDMIKIQYDRYAFFKTKGIYDQASYSLDDYLSAFLGNYIVVKTKYKHWLKEFRSYIYGLITTLPRILINNRICRLKKATLIVSALFPKVAFKIIKKYFPELINGMITK